MPAGCRSCPASRTRSRTRPRRSRTATARTCWYAGRWPRRWGGFPIDLGRIGTRLLSNEETVLQYRLLAAGYRIVYDGGLVVDHVIEPERLTRRWITRRAFWGGVSEVATARKVGYGSTHLNPVKALVAMCLFWTLSRVRDPHAECLIRSHYARGVLVGWWQNLERHSGGGVRPVRDRGGRRLQTTDELFE